MKHPDYIDGKCIRLQPTALADRHQIYEALARSELTDILLGHPSQDPTPLLSYEQFCNDYKLYYFDDSSCREVAYGLMSADRNIAYSA